MEKSRTDQAKPSLRCNPRRAMAWILPRALRTAPPCVVFLGFLALYTATLSPDVLPADSGEFQRVAATAAVAHPPGYPLYTMLGWLFARLPLGPTPAWRVSFFSAVTTAAAVALLFRVARRLTNSVLGALASALAFGSATTVWATATTASIRPLTALFTTLCVCTSVRHAARVEEVGDGRDDHYLILFCLALSFGVTHHPSLLFPGIVFLLYLVLVDPRLLRQPRRWTRPLVALLPGLLVLAYLPLRGGPRLRTVSGFLDHLLARGFRGDMFALGLVERIVILPTLLRFQFNVVLLVGIALGALVLLWRDRKLALLLIGSALVHMTVTLTYDAPQTVEYAIPTYVSLALLLSAPFELLPGELGQTSESSLRSKLASVAPIAGRAGGGLLLLAGVLSLGARLPSYSWLSNSYDTRGYIRTLLDGAPPRAVLLCNWHWYTPLRYVQEIEGSRPDVTVEYVAPRGEPLAQTWVRSIERYVEERPVVVIRFFEQEYKQLPYTLEPLGEAFLVRAEARQDVPADLTSLDAILGDQIELLGYRIVNDDIRPDQPLEVILAWRPTAPSSGEIGLFAQLIGPDGGLWSAAEDPRRILESLSPGETVLQRVVLYPRLDASPRTYSLVVGAYGPEGRLPTEDGSDHLPVEQVLLHPSTSRPVTERSRLVRFTGGPTLIGVDYDLRVEGSVRTYLHWAGPGDAVQIQLLEDPETPIAESGVPPLRDGEYATLALDTSAIPGRLSVFDSGGTRRWNGVFRGPIRLPAAHPEDRYVPFGDALVLTSATGPPDGLDRGREVTLRLRLRGQRPLQRDYIVSTSLTGLREDGTWAWRASHDTVPALGAIPTLKWIRGSPVMDPHRIRIPDETPDVPTVGTLVVYDHFTQRRLPHLDERFGPVAEIVSWPVRP